MSSDDISIPFGRETPAPDGSTFSVEDGGLLSPGLVFVGSPTMAAEFLRELAIRNNGVVGRERDLPVYSTNGLRTRVSDIANRGLLSWLFGENSFGFQNGTSVDIDRARPAADGTPRVSIGYHGAESRFFSPAIAGGDSLSEPGAPFFPVDTFGLGPTERRLLFGAALNTLTLDWLHRLSFDQTARATPDAVVTALLGALAMTRAAGGDVARMTDRLIQAVPQETPATLDILSGMLGVGVSITPSWNGELGITFYFDQVNAAFALHGDIVTSGDRIGIEWQSESRGGIEEPSEEAIRAFLSAMFSFEVPQDRGTSGAGGPAGRMHTSADSQTASGTIGGSAEGFAGGIIVVDGIDPARTARSGDGDAEGSPASLLDVLALPGAANDGSAFVPLPPVATPSLSTH